MSYLTFSSLGSSGGMCSQLQSYASLLAVAKANNKEIVFSKSMFNVGCGIKIFDLLDITPTIKPDDFFKEFKIKEINFNHTPYDETLFNLDNSNYDIGGRFDLYTYWYNDIKKTVDGWKFKEDIFANAQERLKRIKNILGWDKPTVSIHIRRGDYMLDRNHALQVVNEDYYINSIIKEFNLANDFNFLIFSNDIEYVKNINFLKLLNKKYSNVWFVEPKDIDSHSYTSSEKDDLALLSLCDNHIITNSSYSWWGAYLSKNPNKKVICPTCWLNPRFNVAEWINGKYFPSSWINVDNI
tara:strand:- start:1735 stop:2625 length:891 start_codon:yes stop_codon:yes gene_type:complete